MKSAKKNEGINFIFLQTRHKFWDCFCQSFAKMVSWKCVLYSSDVIMTLEVNSAWNVDLIKLWIIVSMVFFPPLFQVSSHNMLFSLCGWDEAPIFQSHTLGSLRCMWLISSITYSSFQHRVCLLSVMHWLLLPPDRLKREIPTKCFHIQTCVYR